MTAEHRCVCCPQLRPGEPRIYERPTVCEGCRSRLRSLLAEVVELYAAVELEPGATAGSRVSGSRTPPLPLAVAALDLTLPAHLGTVHDPFGDQAGDISATTVLESWARDWQTYTWALLPEATVAALAAWLRERLDWACDHHPAVDDFAFELSNLVGKLRPRAPRAELMLGVPCRDCDRLTLYRWPGSDYIECDSCTVLLTPEEYQRWTELIAAPEHLPWTAAVIKAQKETV